MERWLAEGSSKVHMAVRGANESPATSGSSPQVIPVIPVRQWHWPYPRLLPAVHLAALDHIRTGTSKSQLHVLPPQLLRNFKLCPKCNWEDMINGTNVGFIRNEVS